MQQVHKKPFFQKYSIDQILTETDYSNRSTKLICSIGPASWDVPTIVQMIDAGMNVARLNFSHGDHKRQKQTLDNLREAFLQRRDQPVAIALDTRGPQIRTGFTEDHKPIDYKKGSLIEISNILKQLIIIQATDYSLNATPNRISCNYLSLPSTAKVGGLILLADGYTLMTVREIKEKSIIVELMNDATIGEVKNLSIPGQAIDLPTISQQDEIDIVEFALKYNVDLIFLSFTRKASDIKQVRDLLGPRGAEIRIIAKIENHDGLQNYDDILAAADGIMVARGDLGMQLPPQKVFQAQKWMIGKAVEAGKPIITARQMLESIMTNPRPTRAEASDVANAVLDGSDCVMLSGETAKGKFPVVAVQTMSKICKEAELCYDNEATFWSRIVNHGQLDEAESLALSSVQISFEIKVALIICFTLTGQIARLISKHRPRVPIVAIRFLLQQQKIFNSTQDKTIKYLTLCSGVICLSVPSFQGTDSLLDYAIKNAKGRNLCKTGDRVIILLTGKEEDENHPDQSSTLKIKKVQ